MTGIELNRGKKNYGSCGITGITLEGLACEIKKSVRERKRNASSKAVERFAAMSEFDRSYRGNGRNLLAGVDEVGRGPLAGPVVAAAVILPADIELIGIDDSKKLTRQMREKLFVDILERAVAVGIGIVNPDRIDEINILRAAEEAMNLAVMDLEVLPNIILIDGRPASSLAYPHNAVVKGDSKSLSIAAASIVAKVLRDRIMSELSAEYPAYGFDRNMGYPTAEHFAALEDNGPSPYHRRSFKLVR